MQCLYFPESIYLEAHADYIKKTGKTLEELHDYCVKNPNFFVDIAFAYVDKEPYPIMKELES
jgi:hypothetical protein